MCCVKYNTHQHMDDKEQKQARENIGLVSACLNFIDDLATQYEEEYWSEQPIEVNTLRISFENKLYDPVADNKATGGTWTKLKTTVHANIWDWQRIDNNWYRENSFGYSQNDIHVDLQSPTPLEMYLPRVTKITVNPNVVITENFKIISSNTANVENMKAMFQGAVGLKEIWKNFDFTNCIDVSYMFNLCVNLRKIPANDAWYFPLATSARCMFTSCNSLETDLPYMNFPVNTSLHKAFMCCSKIKKSNGFNSPLCTDMRDLFEECISLKTVKTFGDTSKVETWHDCLCDCISLEKVPDFLDMSSGVDCSGVFAYCVSLKELPEITWGNNVTTLKGFLRCCSNITEIPNWIVFNYVQVLESFMSADYNYFGEPPRTHPPVSMTIKVLPSWFPPQATNVEDMFYGCKNIENGISSWYTFLSQKSTPVTKHDGCFELCGVDTEEGRKQLETVPDVWK